MRQVTANIVDRGTLADVLRGKKDSSQDKLPIRDGQLPVDLDPGQVAVVYAKEKNTTLPSIIIVREGELRELFAWINTYCPFVTPLSQWCRVVTEPELKMIGAGGVRVPQYGGAMTAWAGAMIGEAMLRTGVHIAPQNVSLAVLQSCSTFVAARAFGLRGSKGRRQAVALHEEARQLLHSLTGQQNVGYYDTLWNVLEELARQKSRAKPKASLSLENDIIVECCRDIQKNGFVERNSIAEIISALRWPQEFEEYEHFTSEQRLEIYDLAVARLLQQGTITETTSEMLGQFLVAYFASKISGNVSGHIHLIERLLPHRPMIILWYGVLSALYQPEIWGSEFEGLARLAARELRYPVRLADAPRCDVSLEELRTLVDYPDTYSNLGFRGASPKSLSVELSVGVTGVFRLIDGSEELPKRAVVQVSEETRSRMQHVIASLRSALEAAEPVRLALDEQLNRGSTTKPPRYSKRSTPALGPEEGGARNQGPDNPGQYKEGKLPLDEPR